MKRYITLISWLTGLATVSRQRYARLFKKRSPIAIAILVPVLFLAGVHFVGNAFSCLQDPAPAPPSVAFPEVLKESREAAAEARTTALPSQGRPAPSQSSFHESGKGDGIANARRELGLPSEDQVRRAFSNPFGSPRANAARPRQQHIPTPSVPARVAREPCETCGGNGRTNCWNCSDDGTNQCLSCSGLGTQSHYGFHSGVVRNWTCVSCDGSGREPCLARCDGGSFTCLSCDGQGHVPAQERRTGPTGGEPRYHPTPLPSPAPSYRHCTACQGKGNRTCHSCVGTGDNPWTTGLTCSICSGRKKITCRMCQGSRRIRVR